MEFGKFIGGESITYQMTDDTISLIQDYNKRLADLFELFGQIEENQNMDISDEEDDDE